MTRTTNARVAGITFLLYIALGIAAMILSGRAMHGEGIAEKLASMAGHAGDMRLAAVLSMATGFAALILGVTLYALTREQDRDLAALALTCRVVEGVVGGTSIQRAMGLLWIATASGPNAPTPGVARDLAASLLWGQTWSPTIGATFFAVGSALFSWLLLRGRMIPVALAWLGVLSSVLLAVALPLQLAAVLSGAIVQWLWLPMAAFEVSLALWLLAKGVKPPRQVSDFVRAVRPSL